LKRHVATGSAVIGVGAGVAGALLLTRMMQRLLFEEKPTDSLTFVFISVLLLGVVLFGLLARRFCASTILISSAIRP
jgi:hypothetical protein